jgi:hypothetical protein
MWNVDFVQFARLLNEIAAVGLDDKQMKAISASMNVKQEEVKQLLTRATTKWEELSPLLKKKTPLTEEQSLEEVAEEGDVKAVVTMELDEIFGHFDDTAVESICDELADRATKMPASKINHKLLFADGDTLYMQVQVFPEGEDEEDDVEELE